MMKYFLGVDGGGTKTTAVVSDENGNLIKTAVGGSINYFSNSFDTARKNFSGLFDTIGIYDFESAVIGMSALSEATDDKTAREFSDGIIKVRNLVMNSDIDIAFSACGWDGARAVLICGTGSMAAAVTDSGEHIHKGGLGYLLGDEGSGYDIALSAIKSLLKNTDTDDILLPMFYEFFGVSEENEIIGKFYNPPMPRDEIAAFCKVVFEAYSNGSLIAKSVLDRGAYELSLLSQKILSYLPEDSPLYLYGGLFENSPEYVKLLNSHLKKEAGLLPYPPVLGALFDAYRLSGIEPSENTKQNLRKELLK